VPGNFGITESVSTAASAGVLLVGGYLAQRYGKRANPSVRARAFWRANGGTGLEVRVTIKCVGLKILRIRRDGNHVPTLRISEVVDTDTDTGYVQTELQKIVVANLKGQIAGPGETINCTELFHVPSLPANLVGWLIELVVEVRRPIRRWKSWTWDETVFVTADTEGYGEFHGSSDQSE
jgi:hypothetical protein